MLNIEFIEAYILSCLLDFLRIDNTNLFFQQVTHDQNLNSNFEFQNIFDQNIFVKDTIGHNLQIRVKKTLSNPHP